MMYWAMVQVWVVIVVLLGNSLVLWLAWAVLRWRMYEMWRVHRVAIEALRREVDTWKVVSNETKHDR
jgi:hypothetical protein